MFNGAAIKKKLSWHGLMLKSFNMNTRGVSFNLSADSNNQGLPAKSVSTQA